jgi:hypothetical protein
MGSVGIVIVLTAVLVLKCEKPYLRTLNRSNTRKGLEMAGGQPVYYSAPAKAVAEVLA